MQVQLLAGGAPFRGKIDEKTLAARAGLGDRGRFVAQPGDFRNVRFRNPAHAQHHGAEQQHERRRLERLLATLGMERKAQRSAQHRRESERCRNHGESARAGAQLRGSRYQREHQTERQGDQRDAEHALHRLHPGAAARQLERAGAEDEKEQSHPQRVAEEHPEPENRRAARRDVGQHSSEHGPGARRRHDPGD